MDMIPAIGSATTVLSFVTFIAIVAWAYSRRRKGEFDDAANAPFALPDDDGPRDAAASRADAGERR